MSTYMFTTDGWNAVYPGTPYTYSTTTITTTNLPWDTTTDHTIPYDTSAEPNYIIEDEATGEPYDNFYYETRELQTFPIIDDKVKEAIQDTKEHKHIIDIEQAKKKTRKLLII